MAHILQIKWTLSWPFDIGDFFFKSTWTQHKYLFTLVASQRTSRLTFTCIQNTKILKHANEIYDSKIKPKKECKKNKKKTNKLVFVLSTFVNVVRRSSQSAAGAASPPPTFDSRWLWPPSRSLLSPAVLCAIKGFLKTTWNMSALLHLKTSLGRIPPRIARLVVGCSYHTDRGVYGYRPKQTGRDLKFQADRVSALNQGQYRVKLQRRHMRRSWRVPVKLK